MEYWQPSPDFIKRFEALHQRLMDKWGTGTSKAAWEQLGVPHGGDWSDFKNSPDSVRSKATKSSTIAERIISALYTEAASSARQGTWAAERVERIALGDMLHKENCTQNDVAVYTHPHRPEDASMSVERAVRSSANSADGLWRVVDQSEFVPPGDISENADLFVRGFRKVPWWTATTIGHVRSDRIKEVLQLFQTRNIVVLLGPIGQGKSVLLRQVAKQYLDERGAVAEIVSPNGVDLELVRWIDANPKPLLLVDGLDFNVTLPAAFSYRIGDGNKAKILLAYESRLWPLYKTHFGTGWKDYEVPDPDSPERLQLVDMIDRHRQAETPDTVTIRRLIDHAYRDFPDGGLWVALYSATKGQGLEERMRELVERLWVYDPMKFWALAATVFVNAIDMFARRLDPRKGFGDALRSAVIAELLGHLDLKLELRAGAQAQLATIGQWLDQELLSDGMGGYSDNPSLEFRAPAVTDVLFRHIFGAHEEVRGSRRIDRWKFYLPLARAFTKPGSPHIAINCLRLMHRLNRDVRFVNHTSDTRNRLGINPRLASEQLAQIADVALEAENQDPNSLARIRLWRAQIRAGARTIDVAELQQAMTDAGPQPDVHFLVEMADTLERWSVILRDPVTAIERDWVNVARRAESAMDDQKPPPRALYIELFKIFARNKSHSADDLARLATKSQYFTHPDNDFAMTCHHISERWVSREEREAAPTFAHGSGGELGLKSLLSFYRSCFETMATHPQWRRSLTPVGGTAGHLDSILRNYLKTFEAVTAEADPELLAAIHHALDQKTWYSAFDLHGRLATLHAAPALPSSATPG